MNEAAAVQAGQITATGLDEKAGSHFCDAYVAGDFIFVSGFTSCDADANLVGGDDIEAQARHVFQSIDGVLAKAGASLRDIVSVTIFVLDMDDVRRIAGVRRELFGDHKPASTAVEVSALMLPGGKIEINAIAQRPGR